MRQVARTVESRPRYRGVLLAAVAALVGLGLTASAARAACLSSTPGSASFPDAPADGGPAPEITEVNAAVDSTCGVTIDPAIAQGGMALGDAVEVYMDTDGNGATGSPEFSGADWMVVTFAALPPVLAPWNGSDFDFFNAVPLPPTGVAGYRVGINQLAVPAPTTIGLVVISSHDDRLGSVYLDAAPDMLTPPFPFPVDFSAGSQTAPASTPGSPSAPRTSLPPLQQQSKQGCVVPRVRGLSIARAKRRLRRAGCRYRVRGRGRVRWTAPRAGARTSKRVLVRAKRARH